MHVMNVLSACLISVTIFVQVSGQGKPLKFKPPNEEDTYSHLLPAEVQCDACHAIVYQLNTQFNKFNANNKQYKMKLPESELIELTEKICSTDTFKDYGLKEVEGVRSLTGDGLKKISAAGVISGGGKWPGRLATLCARFVEELGEDGVYSLYVKDASSVESLRQDLCYGNGLLSSCNKNSKKSSKRAENEL